MSNKTKALRHPRELVEAGLAAPAALSDMETVTARYAMALTPVMAAVIDPADPDDPIARQFIPDKRELDQLPQERADPIGDDAHSPLKGIVHRHADRVLLKIVNICPVYCRFCFRREMIGPQVADPPGEQALSPDELEQALGYIAAHDEIWEVIMTGGDPFMLSPRRIAKITGSLGAIPHVKILRWHTRVPIVDPDRVTNELVAALPSSDAATYVVLHANHPRELTAAACGAIARIVDAGIPVLSQSVLLKGVNDDVDVLAGLFRALVAARVKPYYLHHADLAPGTSHFRTTIEVGQRLMRELQTRISGLAMPRYVLDVPGGRGKVPIGPRYREGDGDGEPPTPVPAPVAEDPAIR